MSSPKLSACLRIPARTSLRLTTCRSSHSAISCVITVCSCSFFWVFWRGSPVAYFENPGPRRKFHIFLLRLPVVGKLVRGLNTARFTRTFSILTGSGVPVLESLQISSEVIGNLPMRDGGRRSGRPYPGRCRNRQVAGRQWTLPSPLCIHLISSGRGQW